jgi:hypothetical protein
MNEQELKDLRREDRDEARRSFDWQAEMYKAVAAPVATFGVEAMKAPALIAVAGVAGALGFYSANFRFLAGNTNALDAFNGVIFWLLISLLSSACAPGAAYLSQNLYAYDIGNRDQYWERPHLRENALTRTARIFGIGFKTLAIVAVVGAIGCLVMGGFQFLALIASTHVDTSVLNGVPMSVRGN